VGLIDKYSMVSIDELTQEQLDALEAKATALEQEKGESATKLAELESVKVALEKEKATFEQERNPNWQKARSLIDTMKVALKEKGVDTDAEGNIINNPHNLDVERIRQEAINAARGELIGGKLDEYLAEYDEKSKGLVKHFYDKLSAGENVNLQNIRKYVEQAHHAAEVESGIRLTNKAILYSGGQGPRQPIVDKLDDQQAKELGQRFGLSFASAKGQEQK